MSSRASRVGGICLLRAFSACLKFADIVAVVDWLLGYYQIYLQNKGFTSILGVVPATGTRREHGGRAVTGLCAF